MTESEILQDVLVGQKFLLSMYNQFGLECSNKTLRNLFNSHHSEVSKNNFKIFEVMKKNGQYPIMPAQKLEIEKALEMHSQMQKELNKKS